MPKARVLGFPGGSEVKASAWNAGDLGLILGSGRSPGEGNGTPLQYSCLENPVEGGAWWATVHGVAKSRTRLSDFTFFSFLLLINETKTFHDRFIVIRIFKLSFPSPNIQSNQTKKTLSQMISLFCSFSGMNKWHLSFYLS